MGRGGPTDYFTVARLKRTQTDGNLFMTTADEVQFVAQCDPPVAGVTLNEFRTRKQFFAAVVTEFKRLGERTNGRHCIDTFGAIRRRIGFTLTGLLGRIKVLPFGGFNL